MQAIVHEHACLVSNLQLLSDALNYQLASGAIEDGTQDLKQAGEELHASVAIAEARAQQQQGIAEQLRAEATAAESRAAALCAGEGSKQQARAANDAARLLHSQADAATAEARVARQQALQAQEDAAQLQDAADRLAQVRINSRVTLTFAVRLTHPCIDMRIAALLSCSRNWKIVSPAYAVPVQVQGICSRLVTLLRQLAALHEQAAFQGHNLLKVSAQGSASAPPLLVLRAQALAAATAQLETLLAMHQQLHTEWHATADHASARSETQVTPWLVVRGLRTPEASATKLWHLHWYYSSI
jgi:hypothetical protein